MSDREAQTDASQLRIEPATEGDVPTILHMIRALAEYEKVADRVVATESGLRSALFGDRPYAEVVIGYVSDEPVGFAVYFHSFSTFVGVPGLYLEDLFVEVRWRGQGFGRKLLVYVARVAVARGCQRLEWCALDWNEPALNFYRRVGAWQKKEWVVHQLAGDALAQVAAEAVDRQH